MIQGYLAMLACGALTKFTDNLIDEPFKTKWPLLQFLTGLLYGLLAGFLATTSTEFATLIIGIAIGVLLAGKIDARAHQLAIAAIFAVIAFKGLPTINLALLALFIGLGFLDEALNHLMDKAKEKGIQLNKAVKHAVSSRLSLEIGTIAFGLVTGNFVYFLALISFDLAYNAIDKTMPLFLKRFDSGYGPQLAVDLYKCNAKRLQSKSFLRHFLETFPKESGISGFVIIAESHITIHTYPKKQLAKIDIVSCKHFGKEKAVRLLKKAFRAGEAESQSLYRGKHYPKDMEKAKKIAREERANASKAA
jgi:S-adenosylmethionine decarboxylase